MKDPITPIPWSVIQAEYLTSATSPYICACSQTFNDLWVQPEYCNIIQAEARDFISLKAQRWLVGLHNEVLFFRHTNVTDPERLAIRLAFLSFMVDKETQSSSLNKSQTAL